MTDQWKHKIKIIVLNATIKRQNNILLKSKILVDARKFVSTKIYVYIVENNRYCYGNVLIKGFTIHILFSLYIFDFLNFYRSLDVSRVKCFFYIFAIQTNFHIHLLILLQLFCCSQLNLLYFLEIIIFAFLIHSRL